MYAIVKTGGKQYTVSAGDTIVVEKLDAEIGSQVELPVITLVDDGQVITDADKLAAATVIAEVADQFKGEKQIVFKFKKRKNYKRLRGHRQQLTRLTILGVAATAAAAKAEAKKAAKAAAPAKEAKDEKAEKPAKEAKAAKAEKPAKEAKETKAEKAEEVIEAAAEAIEFEKMTVAQLKEYAAEHEISLKGITKKADIIAAIRG